MMDIQIIFPERDDDALSEALRELDAAICQMWPDEFDGTGGGLGGSNGYGQNFENEVFVMRRQYWGDCTCGSDDRESEFEAKDPGHAPDCYQTELQTMRRAAKLSWHTMKPFHFHTGKLNDFDDGPGQTASKEIYRSLCEKYGVSYPDGCAIHCTCGHKDRYLAADLGHRKDCPIVLPNLEHKRSGLRIEWYKWIGRDNRIAQPHFGEPIEIVRECIASLATAKRS